MTPQFAVFSDLDGCLLNHDDYRYDAAVPVLARLRELGVPVILCSSKTEAEMRPLAQQLDVSSIICCENGGVVCWNEQGDQTVLGASRDQILNLLSGLKSRFRFSSFHDLGVQGIVQATGLPEHKAALAAQRHCTEPLLWQDDENKMDEFRAALEAEQLRLTRGGRFWHVSGQTDKGVGAAAVFERLCQQWQHVPTTIGLGDSPIDQPLLEWADIAVIVPAHDGDIRMKFAHADVRVASHPGSQGWANAITEILNAAQIDN